MRKILLKRLLSAYKGYFYWNKIKKEYKKHNYAYILIPTCDEEEIVYSYLYLDEYIEKNGYDGAVVITDDYNVNQHVMHYCSKVVDIKIVSMQTVDEILQLYSLYNFSTNFLVASRLKPAYRCLNRKKLPDDILMDDFYKLAVYRLNARQIEKVSTVIKRIKKYIRAYIKQYGLIAIPICFVKNVVNGACVYKKMLKKYGNDVLLMCSQYPGTGDVYLQSLFVNYYEEKNNVQTVFSVIGTSAYNLAKTCGVQQVEKLTQKETNDIIDLYKFMMCNVNVKLMHYRPGKISYDSGLIYFSSYKNYNWGKMMSEFGFDGINLTDLKTPQYNYDLGYLSTIFAKYDLKKTKTVLLAPYSNTLKDFSISFWDNLFQELKKEGYSVCTNVGSNSEEAIKGTIPIFIPYEYLIPFIEYAGVVISFRSGFSDITSSASAKNIVLYKKQEFSEACIDSFEFFSLKKMGLSDDVFEIEIDETDSKEEIDKVIYDILEFIKAE